MIEVGEYVRYKSGLIRKVSRIIPCYENDLLLSDSYYIEFDSKGDISTYKNKQVEEFIVKHSKNIIDLIEENDYIDGCRVEGITDYGVQIRTRAGDYITIDNDNEINSIVTKEQMKSVEYIVKEEQ